jgi:N-acetyl-1-D-myo-inositol-2-amino-2-deoxy-alpha-D-glucopyranoside deacetylase
MLTEIIGGRRTVHTVADGDGTAHDVSEWLDRKVAAVLAHRSEVRRGALPGLVAGLHEEARRRLLATEWYAEVPSRQG